MVCYGIFCSGQQKTAKDVELFRNRSVHEFYRLKALIALEQGNIQWSKKEKS